MTKRRRQIEAVFEAALERPTAERSAWLAGACAGDADLHREVCRLLAAHERAEGILDGPLPVPGDLPFPSPDLTGRRIGPYRLVRELGRGGMGRVYLAERDDDLFRRQVAVKVLQQGLGDEDRLRFAAERRILATLQHPNIARLYDGGVTDDGLPYIVMECVSGRRIDHYCDTRRLPVDERLRLFRMVCDAVDYAHRNLVVHRDLKPANVLVTQTEGEARVKLLDFGIAKLLDTRAFDRSAEAPVTRTGVRLMTPAYASPEQICGETITTASDVYALGLILYELLTGCRPYVVAGRSPSDVERLICEQEPTRPSRAVAPDATSAASGKEAASTREVARRRQTTVERLRRQLRGDLDTICMKALRKEPERRYGSAAALAEDLERYRTGRPVRARRDTPGYRARTFIRRHRWGVAVGVLLLLLVAGYVATVTLQARQIAAERDRAQLEAMKESHVKEFLIDLFGHSRASGEAGGRTDTVSASPKTIEDILAAGAARVRRDLAGYPEIQTEMLSALAAVYERLGDYDEARPLFAEVLASRRARSPAAPAEVAAALRDLAGLELRAGRPARADTLYRDALAVQRALHGERAIEVAETQFDLANALDAEGRDAEAAVRYGRALPVYRRVLGSGHGQTADLMTRLAALKCDAGDADALALYRDALGMELERLGREDPHVATLRGEYGACLRTFGRYAEAEKQLLTSLQVLRAPDEREQAGAVRAQLETLYERWHRPEHLRALRDRTDAPGSAAEPVPRR